MSRVPGDGAGSRQAVGFLADAAVVAVVALATFFALRNRVGDYYRVPTDSMQPVLHGDPQHGDLVYVDRLVAAADCRRGDLVVVAHPQDVGQQMVKRIAASGDDPEACWIDLRDGDLWLGGSRQRLEREAKDLVAGRAVRVPWARWPAEASLFAGAAVAVGDDGIRLPAAAADPGALRVGFAAMARRERLLQFRQYAVPEGCFGTSVAIDANYTTPDGGRSRDGDDATIVDTGVELQVLEVPEHLLIALDGPTATLVFHWQPAAGALALWHDGDEAANWTLPTVQGAHHLEAGRLDGRLFFAVDHGPGVWLPVPKGDEQTGRDRRSGLSAGPRWHVLLAVAGSRPLVARELLVFRDLYAWRERIAGLPDTPGDWPRFVPPAHWFLLGDNSFDSRDSRHFDAVPASSLLGRPACVLGPWPRFRWLRP